MARNPRRVVRLGIVIAITAVALLAAAQAVDFGSYNLRLSWLDADHRLSVFAIVSLLAQAATALASAAQGAIASDRRAAWFTLAVLVGGLVPLRALTSFNASILAVPLVCVFALLCFLTWDDVTSRRLVWSALLLLAGSLLLHKVGPDADSSTVSDYTWSYQWVGIVKHGAELAGWTLAATAIVARIATSSPASDLEPDPEPASTARIAPRSD